MQQGKPMSRGQTMMGDSAHHPSHHTDARNAICQGRRMRPRRCPLVLDGFAECCHISTVIMLEAVSKLWLLN